MDKYFNKLEQLVFDEKYTIRAINVTNIFSLHIKQAQFLLESFAEKHNNLIIKYGLVGYRGEKDDEVGSRRYIEIEKEDIENEKKNFTKLISCTIKSIKEKDNLLNKMYDLDSQNLQLNKDEVINYQKNGFYLNTNFEFREKQLKDLVNRIDINANNSNSFNKKEDNLINKDQSNSKNESKIKQIKVENKKPDLFASFKQAAKPKDEEIKQNGKNDKKDEFIKLKNESNELDNKKNSINDIEMDDSNDEPINKNNKDIKKKNDKLNDIASDDDEPISKTTKQIKRTSKQLESDSDDDFSKENIKHKNKKQRKRIAKVFDDSSDEELEQKNDDEMKEEDQPKYRPPKEEVSSKLIEEEETYTDEEGYKVTRKTKKIVKEEPKIDNTQITKSVNDKTNKQKNDYKLENKKKSDTSDDKKSITKSKQPPKNQTSIMNFFKPKNQSK